MAVYDQSRQRVPAPPPDMAAHAVPHDRPPPQTAAWAVSDIADIVRLAPPPRLTWSPEAARFLTANAAAEQFWGCTPGTLVTLTHDGAMPSLARLGAIAEELRRMPGVPRTETLVFWTVRGSQRWTCRLSSRGGSGPIEIEILSKGPSLRVTKAAAAERPPQPSPDGIAPAGAKPAATAEQRAANSADAATLNEIARQIRHRMAAPAASGDSHQPDHRSSDAARQLADLEEPTNHAVASALVDRINQPAILFGIGEPYANRPALALLHEPDRATLARRGGPLAAIAGLPGLLAQDPSALISQRRLIAHPRGRPPLPVLVDVQWLTTGGPRNAADRFEADRGCGANRMPRLVTLRPASDAAPSPNDDDRRRTEFFAKVGHEVRTPLGSIIGFAEIMRDEALGPIENPKYKGYVSDILESARHALSLIDDLLDLSRAQAGALVLDFVELDLNMTLRPALATLQPQAEKAEITLRTEFHEDLPHLIADRRSIKQMLLNLVGNAIKFTPPAGVVTVRTALSAEGGLVVQVEDTGEGMSAADIALALLPFRQVGAQPGRHGGTGLGLPLTKALAEANGATLTVTSRPGSGTSMRLEFAPDRAVPI